MSTFFKLSLEHHDEVVNLFGTETKNYYFLLNDLLDHRYEGESFHVYGEYEDGVLVSILLNNFRNLTYFAREEREMGIYRALLPTLHFDKLSGPSRLLEHFIPEVKVQSDTKSYLGVVDSITAKHRFPELPCHTVRTKEEVGRQYDLLMSTKEYSLGQDRHTYITEQYERIRHSKDRTVYLSIDDRMVASCSTIRETRNSAILIGVVTHPEYRNRGYGSEILLHLFEQLRNEGKYPYLFYNNPAARSVYLKLGMTEVCKWRVVQINKE